MTSAVPSAQRFMARHPCPICGGGADMPSGRGVRCYGFLSSDGSYAHCTREDLAQGLQMEPESQTFAHRLHGSCRCGKTHGDSLPEPHSSVITQNGAAKAERLYRDFRAAGASCAYDYRDEFEDVLYQVWRIPKANGEKTFIQTRPVSGGWSSGIAGIRRVLYRLPELLAAELTSWVLIVEGEKDVDRLAELGIVATTNAMGAGKWLPEYTEHLQGRRVCLVLDNDPDGEKHGDKVGGALNGVAADIRVLRLPSLPPKGDVSDWLNAGGTADELMKLVIFAPRWESSDEFDQESESPEEVPRSRSYAEILALDLPPARPLVDGILEEGTGCILAGPGGTGKTWLSLDLARAVASGTPWLGHFQTSQAPVLVIDEEGNERGLQGRLRLLDAAQPLEDPPIWFTIGFGLKIDADATERVISQEIERYEPGIVIFDSLTRMHSANENDASEMSQVFARFSVLRKLYGCTIVLIDHLRKKGLINDEAEMLRGSTDKRNWPDTILFVSPSENGTMTVSHIKSRYGQAVPDFSVALEIDNDTGVGRVRYQGQAPSQSITKGNEIIAAIHALKTQLGEDGASTMTIAAWLDVSENTIRKHVKGLVAASIVRTRRITTDGRPKDVYDVQGGVS